MLPQITVLVVDDDEDAQRVTRAVLEEGGYKVVVARDGREAVQQLVTSGILPGAIVLDSVMPVMDGGAVVRVLRSYNRLATIPIILHSAYPVDPIVAALCQAVVPKHELHDKLLPTVRKFARGTFPPILD